MYKHILIATDGSDIATRAVRHGIALAKTVGADVTIVTVSDPTSVVGAGYATIAGTILDPLPQLLEAQAAAARRILEDAEALAKAAGVTATTALIEDSFPAEGINHKAETRGADLIVMGSHGHRGLSRLLLGSQTNNVLVHAKVPVLVVR